MAEDSRLRIKLHLYDTDLSVNIDREDEEMYRKTARLITETVGNYMTVYKGLKGDKDILYMALVDITMRYQREQRRNDVTPYSDVISRLSSEISALLEQ